MLPSARRAMLCAVSILALAPLARGGPLQLHPRAQRLPCEHQGPFVTTGDGGILAVDDQDALVSHDEGKSWERHPLFKEAAGYRVRPERALLRTTDGVVLLVFLNDRERQSGKWGISDESEVEKWRIPTYVARSRDDGKTWEEPIKLQDRWCGAIRCLVELADGRLVLVGQKLIPWRHVSLTYVSDDQGRTWKASNLLDLGGSGDHDGAMEATVVQRKDSSLYMLIRTTKGWQYEAVSTDGGLTWKDLKNSGIQSSTCCATLARLADGKIAMLWNRAPAHAPGDLASREELSIAFSGDECKTWSKPTVVAARYARKEDDSDSRRVSYPYLYERKPGELWITTMQGGLRMRIRQADLDASPDPVHAVRPRSIVMFGDSTTARRQGIEKVYAQRVLEALHRESISAWVTNAGVPGDTTSQARERLDKDVLAQCPDLVVIQFGSNDACIDVWKDPPATKPRVSLPRYEENLRYLIGELRSRDIAVIVMTTNHFRWTPKLKTLYGRAPYDPDNPTSFTDTMLREYNESVRKIARELGVRLVDVLEAYDQYESKTGNSVDSLLVDGMHPNDRGHELVAERLLPAIRSELDR